MATYTIDATTKGTILNGIVIRPQDRFIIRWMSGYWTSNPTVGPNPYDANGNPNWPHAEGSYLLPGAPEGGLIGCIGNPATTKFWLGNYGVAGDGVHAGALWLAINDDWSASHGAGYADNQGSVTVSVEPVAALLATLKTEQQILEFAATIGQQLSKTEIAAVSGYMREAIRAAKHTSGSVVPAHSQVFTPEKTV